VSEYIPTALQREIRAQFAGCCAYCHTAEALTVVIFEIEHILPRSAGGQTVLGNLCLACPTCNRYKADRTSARDVISGEEVPLFHPQYDA
jgi:5-methylcytosine-specific restriction endonuclease McrA